jgi:transcriptional regulator with XRE-family HTH domain
MDINLRVWPMRTPSYKADELSRATVLNELIGNRNICAFASKFGLTSTGLINYLYGGAKLTKQSGKVLAVRLKLPVDYFEVVKPGSKNRFNSPYGHYDEDEDAALTGGSAPHRLAKNFSEPESDILNTHPVLIGKRLREERMRLGISVNHFTYVMAINGSTQTMFEEGLKSITAEYLSLAQARFHIDVNYILTAERRVSEDNHKKQIGERLKEERIRMNTSQEDFSGVLATPIETQILYESGVESIPVQYLSLAAFKFDINVYYILSGK